MVALGTSERGVLVSSAIGATMSKAAIASTANSSAFRKPVQPAVAAVGLSGWKDRFPAIACLMMMYRESSATKPASIAMNHPITLAEIRMSFFVMYADDQDRDEAGQGRAQVPGVDAEEVEERVEEQPEHDRLQDAPVDVGDDQDPAEPHPERRRGRLPEPGQGRAGRGPPVVHDRVAGRRGQHRHRDRGERQRDDRAGDALHDPEVEVRGERQAHVGDPHDHQAPEPERVRIQPGLARGNHGSLLSVYLRHRFLP